MRVYETCLVADILTPINYYRMNSRGVNVCTSPPVLLNGEIVRPHVVAQVNGGSTKQCSVSDHGQFDGAPNLIAQVFPAESIDGLGAMLELYQNAGVKEFIAWQHKKPLFRFYRLIDGEFHEVELDEDDLIKSHALPGLWFNLSAFRERKWRDVLTTIDQGIESEEHVAFVEDVMRGSTST